MGNPQRNVSRATVRRSPIQVLEEAFHLLRGVDARSYFFYAAGVVPFAVAMLYFCADMARSSRADEAAMKASLMMVMLYFWLRWCQCLFCAGLWQAMESEGSERVSWRQRIRAMISVLFLYGLQVPALLFGLFFLVPLGWVIAFYQNLAVLGANPIRGRDSLMGLSRAGLHHAHRDWAQNHGILLMLGCFSFFAWINVAATCFIMPTFAKSFFGVESAFTLSSIAAVMNSTFILGTLLLTYIIVFPIAKAAYLIRCFYGDSTTTGDDLRNRLEEARQQRKPSHGQGFRRRGREVAVLLGMILGMLGTVEAQPDSMPEAETARVSPAVLEKEISDTLAQKKYQWRLPRLEEDSGGGEQSWFSRRINEIAEATRNFLRDVGEWFREMVDRLERSSDRNRDRSSDFDFSGFKGVQSGLTIGLVLIVAGLLLWLGWVLWKKYRGNDTEVIEDELESGPIDLTSESIVASQLPEGEWMQLAREQLEQGDPRLAIRALFLASLAILGEERLLETKRFKSNADYRRELRFRARKAEELIAAFERNVLLFERVWYGWHEASSIVIDEFFANHETIRNQSKALRRPAAVAVGAN